MHAALMMIYATEPCDFGTTIWCIM